MSVNKITSLFSVIGRYNSQSTSQDKPEVKATEEQKPQAAAEAVTYAPQFGTRADETSEARQARVQQMADQYRRGELKPADSLKVAEAFVKDIFFLN